MAAGLSVALAFPPVDIGWAAFIGMVPLALTLQRDSKVWISGTAFGLTFFGIILYWIRLFGLHAYIALTLLQTAFVVAAIVSAAVMRRRLGPRAAWLALPLAWVAAEYLRSKVPLGGFSWGGLGYSQHNNLWLLKLASITGVWGVGFVVVLVASLIAEVAVGEGGAKRKLALLASCVLLVGLPGLIPAPTPDGNAATVAMVQGNAPEGTYDPHEDDLVVLKNHAELTRTLAGSKPSLVVWPESSLDSDPFADERYIDAVTEVIGQVDAPFLIGANLDAEEGADGEIVNASLFFRPGGTVAGEYHKQHLVPFGERVPIRSVLEPIISELARVPFDVVPGDTSDVFTIDEGTFGSVICYESTYPGLVRSFVANGARLLIVSTNNSSFERTAASEQHVAFSQVRAAEQRMWVAHTALTGISAVVAPDGRVLERTELFEQALLTPTVRFATATTFYARFGDWFPLLALGLVVLLLIWPFIAKWLRSSKAAGEPDGEISAASKTLVVVPTFNEASNIELLLDLIRLEAPDVGVLVVDDGSPDGTAGIVAAIAATDPRINLMSRPDKLGIGRAYVAGFEWGLARGYDRLMEMDADLSHDPRDINRLQSAVAHADLAIGSRYVPGGGVQGWSRFRHLLSMGGNLYARIFLRFDVRDATSGFRCYRAETLRTIGLDNVATNGYSFQIDMAYRAWRKGLRVIEIPIIFRERERGTSKMSQKIVFEALRSIAVWGVRDMMKNKP